MIFCSDNKWERESEKSKKLGPMQGPVLTRRRYTYALDTIKLCIESELVSS